MQYFPPIPTWEGLHPIVVHFPIGLLLAAPVLVVLALIFPKGRSLAYGALAMMVMGTLGALLATATGDAASDAAEAIPGVKAAVEHHEELAETARNIFIGLTVLYAAIAAWAGLRGERLTRRTFVLVNVVFLAFYGAGSVVLMNAGHAGGLLVHRYGVHAPTTDSQPLPATPGKHDNDD